MTTLDPAQPYRVLGQPGIAWRTLGYAWCHDRDTGETEEDPDIAVMVMIGDDRRWEIPVTDLLPIAEADYCAGCGQIGCTADTREHDDPVEHRDR